MATKKPVSKRKASMRQRVGRMPDEDVALRSLQELVAFSKGKKKLRVMNMRIGVPSELPKRPMRKKVA
jgi:hypothetical protein